MQALMCLAGQGLTVEEADIKKAESFGDMKRREPVQLREMQLVDPVKDPEEAKTKGNEYFKAGDLSAALAHYERGIDLLRAQEQVSVVALATLLSNAALCLLKLKWPDRAKKNTSLAIAAVRQTEDISFDQSKLFYRRALACEQLADFAGGVEDMARALQQAKKSGLNLTEQHRLKGEIDRLKKLKASAEEDADKKRKQQENEKVAQVQRMQGAKLESKTKQQSREAGHGGASVAPVVPSSDYLSEQDFSHWARTRVAEVVAGISHACQSGARLEITHLQEQSKVQASVVTKKGNRSLFYEMDLHLAWTGKASVNLKPKEGSGEMKGLIRVYNIAHDTKFELGGDENTSYMYQLGWDQRLSGAWVEDIKGEAAELFDKVAVKVDGVIRELRTK
mmetsp:Transcript_38079/g.85838  ORF Transcript_38079/g.85838 Transcript_38079/m.85838 type:complete len:393 (+) Transcript_38079:3-1181(+)